MFKPINNKNFAKIGFIYQEMQVFGQKSPIHCDDFALFLFAEEVRPVRCEKSPFQECAT